MAVERVSGSEVELESSPTALESPTCWRSLEAEDLTWMSRAVFSKSLKPDFWTSVRKANFLIENLVTQLPDIFYDVEKELGLMTLKGRLQTFPDDWNGWPPLEMALCGLYINSGGKVTCIICGVIFRQLMTREVCQVQRHKQLSPFCLQLKRCQCHGPRQAVPGRRIRRNSDTAVFDLGNQDTDIRSPAKWEIQGNQVSSSD